MKIVGNNVVGKKFGVEKFGYLKDVGLGVVLDYIFMIKGGDYF